MSLQNGDLCISILHPPVDDPQSGELPCERWNPTQNVRTILLSVISLLNEPNTFSPANVDASVMYRRWRDSNGRDNEYPNIIRFDWLIIRFPFFVLTATFYQFVIWRKQAQQAKIEAEKEGIVVPTTISEYCLKPKVNPAQEPQVCYFYTCLVNQSLPLMSLCFLAWYDRLLWWLWLRWS